MVNEMKKIVTYEPEPEERTITTGKTINADNYTDKTEV